MMGSPNGLSSAHHHPFTHTNCIFFAILHNSVVNLFTFENCFCFSRVFICIRRQLRVFCDSRKSVRDSLYFWKHICVVHFFLIYHTTMILFWDSRKFVRDCLYFWRHISVWAFFPSHISHKSFWAFSDWNCFLSKCSWRYRCQSLLFARHNITTLLTFSGDQFLDDHFFSVRVTTPSQNNY